MFELAFKRIDHVRSKVTALDAESAEILLGIRGLL